MLFFSSRKTSEKKHHTVRGTYMYYCVHNVFTYLSDYRMKLQHFIVPSGPCVKDCILRRDEPIIISYYMSLFALAGRVCSCVLYVRCCSSLTSDLPSAVWPARFAVVYVC